MAMKKFSQELFNAIGELVIESAIYLIFLAIFALLGGIGFAYITFGAGALLLLLPFAVLTYYAVKYFLHH